MSTSAAIALALSAAAVYFVIRYRVHIHISYTPPPAGRRPSGYLFSSPSGRRRRSAAHHCTYCGKTEAQDRAETIRTLTSALVNLGAPRKKAAAAAERAAAHAGSFEERLRIAIKEAA